MRETEATLLVERVTKRFDAFTAVEGVSLAARAGRIFGLLGPNGAGKTTTIRMIVGITAPDEGRIELFGRPAGAEAQNRIGYLPEERGLYKKMRVGEQLRFFGELKGLDGHAADEAIAVWLERMKLAAWQDKKTDELSKGMQQKVQFIAAVLHNPDLLILDEPFSGLDPVSTELLKEIVLELKAAGKTIIFSTHLMEQAEKLCDDICLLNRARKVLDGSLREIKRSFGRNAVRLRVEGGDGVLEDKRLVARLERRDDHMEALLVAGADEQDLLRQLLAAGARIRQFELAEPSLHDIFIEKVSESA